MTAKQLKNSILQMAVQGKLIPQDSNEEPASVLLERIRTEKQRLINEGKIKKEKPFSPISENEIPFDVPETWEWVRLGHIISVSSGKGLTTSQMTSNGQFPVYGGNGITGYHDISNVEANTLVIGRVGFYCGTTHITMEEAWVTDNALIVSFPRKEIGIHWLRLFIDYAELRKLSSSTAQPLVSGKTIYPLLFPLPPLAEQRRIVERIEQLLPHIADYDIAEQKLTALNATFPDQLKKSILQAAVQGKLVEQNENDEPASVLLERIRAEKEQLTKEGKIKTEKPLPPITDDEIPFDVPESWEWVRLGELCELVTKGSSPKWQGINYVEKSTDSILFITSENVGSEEMLMEKSKYLESRFNEVQSRSILKYNDILTNIVGASIGRSCIYDLEYADSNINQAVALIRLINKDLLRFVIKYLNSGTAYSIMLDNQVESARANISLATLACFLVPIPPLGEQQRIVERIEELLPIIEHCR